MNYEGLFTSTPLVNAARRAADVAKTIYPTRIAEVLAAELTWLARCSWHPNPPRLHELMAEIHADADRRAAA